jgi:hypothetical protein
MSLQIIELSRAVASLSAFRAAAFSPSRFSFAAVFLSSSICWRSWFLLQVTEA